MEKKCTSAEKVRQQVSVDDVDFNTLNVIKIQTLLLWIL